MRCLALEHVVVVVVVVIVIDDGDDDGGGHGGGGVVVLFLRRIRYPFLYDHGMTWVDALHRVGKAGEADCITEQGPCGIHHDAHKAV